MSTNSPLLLIGIGTSGSRIARGISRAFGEDLRYITVDTDASTGETGNDDFILLGGDRLSGRGSGGDVVSGRLAAEDSVSMMEPKLEGVRLAVIVTALGGGTGGGATTEILNRLATLGIPSVVFATTPFSFEGEDRQRSARGSMSMIEDEANAVFFMPLDKLVADTDNMEEAMHRAIDTVASGVTLFWRLIEKPGFIKMDSERIRHLISNCGRGRFAVATAQGPDRASKAVEAAIQSELLSTASAPVQSIVCGILGGEDLRLSELTRISDGIRAAFGEHVAFELGTVNDEATFCGRIAVVIMIFECNTRDTTTKTPTTSNTGRSRSKTKVKNLGVGPEGRGRFNNSEPTNRNGEDLDIPTFVRRNINLDF